MKPVNCHAPGVDFLSDRFRFRTQILLGSSPTYRLVTDRLNYDMTDLDTLSQHQPWLVEMLLQPTLLEVLSSSLSISDFFSLFRVCKRLYRIKNHTLRLICGINAALKAFVVDATMFRAQLGHYNAVISGPFALNFFQLSSNRVSKLDIFVKEGADADQFTDYLQTTEEYKNDSEIDTVRSQCQDSMIHVQF